MCKIDKLYHNSLKSIMQNELGISIASNHLKVVKIDTFIMIIVVCTYNKLHENSRIREKSLTHM